MLGREKNESALYKICIENKIRQIGAKSDLSINGIRLDKAMARYKQPSILRAGESAPNALSAGIKCMFRKSTIPQKPATKIFTTRETYTIIMGMIIPYDPTIKDEMDLFSLWWSKMVE